MTFKGILAMLSFAAALGAAAESPYGVEVVDYVTACDKKMFNNPTNVLGAPKQFVNILFLPARRFRAIHCIGRQKRIPGVCRSETFSVTETFLSETRRFMDTPQIVTIRVRLT